MRTFTFLPFLAEVHGERKTDPIFFSDSWRPLQDQCSLVDLEVGIECLKTGPILKFRDNEPQAVALKFWSCCWLQAGNKDAECWDESRSSAQCCRCFAGIVESIAKFYLSSDTFIQGLVIRPDFFADTLRSLSNVTVSMHGVGRLGSRQDGAVTLLSKLRGGIDEMFARTVGIRAFIDSAQPDLHLQFDIVRQLYAVQAQKASLSLFVARGGDLLMNTFTKEQYLQHLPIFSLFPPKSGPPPQGHILDFLGVATAESASCWPDELVTNRLLECRAFADGLPHSQQWPVLDEEYFEWLDVLQSAVSAARRVHPSLAVAEVGTRDEVTWGVRAAVAFNELAPDHAPCLVLAVDVQERDASVRAKHLAENLPHARCNVQAVVAHVGSSASLTRILDAVALSNRSMMEPRTAPVWDLIDLDCQRAELEIVRAELSQLAVRVRRLHISTHGRAIHREILIRLREGGWAIAFEYFPQSAGHALGLGPFPTWDGHISCTPPVQA